MTKQGYCFLLCGLIFSGSCSVPGSKLFSKRTPHEAYQARLKDAGLESTALGLSWNEAATLALRQAVPVTIPYRETGYFAAERPAAAGFAFNAKKGQIIQVDISTDPNTNFLLFADLFMATAGDDPKFLEAADTGTLGIQYEADSDARYLLRLQPELLKSGSYTVIITDSASLGFPVQAANKPRIGSFWGNSRDGGSRSHEGIDIFAAFRTPVVAAADGFVTRVGENGLGGKVIFLRPYKKNYSLYYAHLDSQFVQTGQAVKTGDTLGLMGNTGNARTTPPHLHFGIYTSGGAVDPLPFVRASGQKPAGVTAPLNALNQYGRSRQSTTVYRGPSTKETVIEIIKGQVAMRVLAGTSAWYKVLLPNAKIGFVPSANVETGKPVRSLRADSATVLMDDPTGTATPKKLLAKGQEVDVLGEYEGYYLARADSITGWIKQEGGK